MADLSRLNIINSSRVLRSIWKNPGISRIEISEELEMDRSTVTKIMNNLNAKGWVSSVPVVHARETVGRKPVGLVINNNIGTVLGIEVKTQSCRAVVTDMAGNIQHIESFSFDPSEETIADTIFRIYSDISRKMEEKKVPVIMVGVGISGLVDPFEGIVKLSNPMDISESIPLAQMLEKHLNIPVVIENDANCCCWSELVSSRKADTTNFLSVLGEFRSTDLSGYRETGIAVGLGMVINGEVYYGDNFCAGEFRSVDWLPDRITQFSIENERSYNIMDNPDALSEVFRELARNLSLVINVLDFHKIILAGDLVNFSTQLIQVFQDSIAANWVYSNLEEKKTAVFCSEYKDNAVAYGAACNALARIFDIPHLGSDRILRGTMLLDYIQHFQNDPS